MQLAPLKSTTWSSAASASQERFTARLTFDSPCRHPYLSYYRKALILHFTCPPELLTF